MKKAVFVTLLVLALLCTMIPVGSVLAKDGGNVNINIRNRTGAPMDIVFTSIQNHNSLLFNLAEGRWNVSIHNGYYSYRAITSCGIVNGVANLDRTKNLSFHCRGKGLDVNLYRTLACPPQPFQFQKGLPSGPCIQ